MKTTYTVIVGNIGTVYDGPSLPIATETFDTYVRHSTSGVGRAGNETVTLFRDDDILREHTGQTRERCFDCDDYADGSCPVCDANNRRAGL